MSGVLFTVAAFIVAISVLIAVHEFGHFWVARKLGVKVLRFSIGFGKPILRRVHGSDNTEYVISALPLGGYVKMLGENDDEVAPEEQHRAFSRQKLWKRMAIVAAGPMFNFLFAIIAYWLMFVIGVTGIKPVIGEIEQGSPAALAGLQTGQEIVMINNTPTPIWDVALNKMLPILVDRGQVRFEVQSKQGYTTQHTLDFNSVTAELEPDNFFDIIGFKPWRPPVRAIIGMVVDDSPAASAGLQRSDRVISIDDVAIDSWQELYNYVSQRPDSRLKILIEREGRQQVVELTPQRVEHNGKQLGRIGVAPLDTGRYADEMRVEYGYPTFTAIGKAIQNTWTTTVVTIKMLGKLLTGEVSVRNLSGPLNIARYAGYSASAGLPWFLKFLAVVSISLGILNLLPIPILDGGHLFYYLIEAVKGSPVSETFQEIGLRIGIVMLILLMSLALYNDILKLLN